MGQAKKEIFFGWFKGNFLFALYSISFFVITLGLFAFSGLKHFDKILIFFVPFCLCYWLLQKLNLKYELPQIPFKLDVLINFAPVGILILIIGHYINMGNIPLLDAMAEINDIKIALIRNNVATNSSTFYNYTYSFLIKAVIPFYILLLFYKKKYKLFWVIAIIGSLYAMSLMQKSFVVVIFIPFGVFLLLSKRWKQLILLVVFLAAAIVFLILVANPSEFSIIHKDSEYSFKMISLGVLNRVLFTPGRTVSLWFDSIPETLPFLEGCGYRFLAPFLDCEYQSYPSKMYDIIYPHYAVQGLHGTFVSTSFMYDYASFGKTGLVFSGVLLALVLSIIQGGFIFNWRFGVIFNAFPIMTLTSSALSTILVTHGWIPVLILAFIHLKEFKNLNTNLS